MTRRVESAAPPLPDETIVAVDGVEYPQITEAACDSMAGRYDSDAPANQSVELCGAACDNFLSVSSAEVQYLCDAG